MASKKNAAGKTAQSTPAEPVFTKEQLVHSKAFSHQKDILMAILDADKTYTKAQVEKLVSEFLKRKV